MTDTDTNLVALKSLMQQFVTERDWQKYHTPRNLAASVAVEAGELLELFQWLTPEEAVARCRDDAEFRQAVGEELSDVLMYLVSLANSIDLDIASAVYAKMDKNRAKYPVEQVKGHYERPVGR